VWPSEALGFVYPRLAVGDLAAVELCWFSARYPSDLTTEEFDADVKSVQSCSSSL
jgi:hypothetical protein